MDSDLRLDANIRRAQESVEEAQKELQLIVAEKFVTGARISWLHNTQYEQFGTVVGVTEYWWSDVRIIAINERTGKVVAVPLHTLPMLV